MAGREDASQRLARLHRACQAEPDRAALRRDYGNALVAVGRHEDAARELRRAISLDASRADAQHSLGVALQGCGDHDGAVAAFIAAIDLAPRLRAAHLSLANLYLHLGRNDDALKHYSVLSEIDPNDPYAFYHLLNMGESAGITEDQLSYFRAYLNDDEQTTLSRVLAGFGLARYFAGAGQHQESFEYLTTANRLHRGSYEFSLDELAGFQAAIKANSRPRQAALAQDHADPTPVFIVGTPRSGSTLCEQILGAHSGVAASGEGLFFDAIIHSLGATNPEGWARLMKIMDGAELEKIRLQFLGKFRSEGERQLVVTDKSLENYRYIGFIKAVFPQARFIHCERHHLASGFSMFRSFFAGHQPFAYDLEEIGAYQALVRDMKSFWGEHFGRDIFTLSHEALVEDPEATIRSLLEFCGLEFESDCLQFHDSSNYVATASTQQVRKPLSSEHTRQWQVYGDLLAPITRGLESRVPTPPELAAPAKSDTGARAQLLIDGLAAQKAGDVVGAIALYRRVLEQHPDDEQAQHLLGMAEHAAGNYTAAIQHLEACLHGSSTPWLVAYHLGRVFVDAGRPEMASQSFRKALKLKPDYAEAHNSLGLVHKARDEIEAAIACFQAAIDSNPEFTSGHDNLIRTLKQHGRERELKSLCESMLAANPSRTQYLRELAFLERGLGQLDTANALYRNVLDINPRAVHAYYGLSLSLDDTLDEGDMNSMRALLQDKQLAASDRVALAFALARSHEKHGELEAAWQHYGLANRTHRESISFKMADQRRFFRRMKQVFSADFASAHRVRLPVSAAHIFIVGMPRSGTTLLEQMLAAHSRVAGAGELSYFGELCREFCNAGGAPHPDGMADISDLELAGLGRRYHAMTAALRGDAELLVDKMPGNFFHLGAIRAALPDARIVHIRRNPQDTCLSIFKNHFTQPHHYAYHLGELANYYQHYQQLMAHWDALYGDSLYTLDYNDLVTDPEATVRKLLDYCGLEFEPACLAFHANPTSVKTASQEQVRQPLYTSGVGSSQAFADYLSASPVGKLAW